MTSDNDLISSSFTTGKNNDTKNVLCEHLLSTRQLIFIYLIKPQKDSLYCRWCDLYFLC